MATPSLLGRTAVLMVVYRLENDLCPALSLLQSLGVRMLVVDNLEGGHPHLAALCTAHGAGYLHGANVGGLAGAYNRGLAGLLQQHPGTEQVVFLDEDSDPSALQGFLDDPQTLGHLQQEAVAAVSPAYRDRATGLRGRYMQLRRFGLDFGPREFSDLREVAFVINSMSVWRVSALQRIGAFNEGLAVDHVDTEYCLRARQAGLKVFVNGSFEFAHAIGERRKYKLFGVELQAGGHGAGRRRMIGRNTAWLARRWVWREPAFAALCVARLGYEAVGIVMAEKQAGSKLLALLGGIFKGLLLPLPQPETRADAPALTAGPKA